MARKATFEQLVVRGEAGYVCDPSAMANLASAGTYDGAFFKLTTKLEMSLLLFTGQTQLNQFTVDVVVVPRKEEEEEGGALNFLRRSLGGDTKKRQHSSKSGQEGSESEEEAAIENAWMRCSDRDYHGLHAIARIDTECLPNNQSRQRYSVGQFVDALLHGIRAYFMFQKHNPLFAHDALDLWDDQGGAEEVHQVCYFVLAWKLKELHRGLSRQPLTPLNTTTTTTVITTVHPPHTQASTAAATAPTKQGKRKVARGLTAEESLPSPASKRVRRSTVQLPKVATMEVEEEEDEEEDTEVTFKTPQKQTIIPKVLYSPDIVTPRKSPPAAAAADSSPSPTKPRESQGTEGLEDITLGFERSIPKGGRKSVGRKSLLPQWPEEEKNDILKFFDTLNPSQSEQTNIALTCKYINMKYDRELTSKQLYQWVQAKGRAIHPPLAAYTLPEGKTNEIVLGFYHSLNPDVSESKRIAFTCRFMKTQYDLTMQSKEFYAILNNKGKKKAVGRRR